MPVVTGSNKRKFQRVETNMPVAVESAAGRMDARIININPDGCQLESPNQVRPSELLTLSFGRQSSPVTFRVKVQSCVRKDKVFQYGTCFWAVDENAKRDLLKSLIQVASLYKPEIKPEVKPETKPEGKPESKSGESGENAEAEVNAAQAATAEKTVAAVDSKAPTTAEPTTDKPT